MSNSIRKSVLVSLLVYFSLNVISIQAAERKPSSSFEQKTEEMTTQIREKLSPLVQTALNKHCGEDCPSFKIETQYKKPSRDLLEDLGFSQPSEAAPPLPVLQSVTLSVLVNDKVPQASKDALKQILTHLVNNETLVPTTVQVKPLNGLSPALEKKNRPEPPKPVTAEDHTMAIFETVIWPASLFIIALLGLTGLLLTLKNRRDLIRDQALLSREASKTAVGLASASAKDEKSAPVMAEAKALMETRGNDLLWLIEDLSLRGDVASLRKLTSIYHPQDLTTQLKFSNQALKVLAEIPASKVKNSATEALSWLKESLDANHWKRMAEQHYPLSKLARLSDRQRSQIFAKAETTDKKAAFLASIPQEKWPLYLSQISKEERVQLGSALFRYQHATGSEKGVLDQQLCAAMNATLEDLSQSTEHLVESFTLYLTEEEGQSLWQEISRTKQGEAPIKKPQTLSIDTLVQELEPAAATEIFTTLELPSLGALVHQLSPEAKQKVYVSLPKSLRDRIAGITQVPSQAQQMQARAHLMDAYRRFTAGSMVQ